MKERYRGFTIELKAGVGGIPFHFDINGKTYHTQTLDQAQRSIDNYLEAKKLLGRKVIGFSGRDGRSLVAQITRLELQESEFWGSAPVRVRFFDESGVELPTIGPFFEYNEKNVRMAHDLDEAGKSEKEAIRKQETLWNELLQRRIDKPIS